MPRRQPTTMLQPLQVGQLVQLPCILVGVKVMQLMQLEKQQTKLVGLQQFRLRQQQVQGMQQYAAKQFRQQPLELGLQ